jgi:hypothetical protein
MFGDHPPQWLRWANTSTARAVTTIMAMIALVLSVYFGFQQQAYSKCVAEQQEKDADRTRAISAATDAERRAERALLQGSPTAAGLKELRDRVTAARAVTDRVRESNPPPDPTTC